MGAKLIAKHIKTYLDKGIPVILTGDFNSTPGDEPIAYLRNHLRDLLQETNQDERGTFHSFTGEPRPGGPIDFMFVSPEWKVRKVEVITYNEDGKYPSDHFPILASLELP